MQTGFPSSSNSSCLESVYFSRRAFLQRTLFGCGKCSISAPAAAAGSALNAPENKEDAQTVRGAHGWKRQRGRTEQHRGDGGDQQPVPPQQEPQAHALSVHD